ncbi:MAG TPA: hypothetical protein VFH27_03715 [Longimicrobiaceae bacterium]|nr:hypothetical protein [Longimicrobiaceae bacterium]
MMILPALIAVAALGTNRGSDLPSLVDAVVSIVRADAVASFSATQPRSLRGPVLLDAVSALDAAGEIGVGVDHRDVMRAVTLPAREVKRREAERCEPWGHRRGGMRC